MMECAHRSGAPPPPNVSGSAPSNLSAQPLLLRSHHPGPGRGAPGPTGHRVPRHRVGSQDGHPQAGRHPLLPTPIVSPTKSLQPNPQGRVGVLRGGAHLNRDPDAETQEALRVRPLGGDKARAHAGFRPETRETRCFWGYAPQPESSAAGWPSGRPRVEGTPPQPSRVRRLPGPVEGAAPRTGGQLRALSPTLQPPGPTRLQPRARPPTVAQEARGEGHPCLTASTSGALFAENRGRALLHLFWSRSRHCPRPCWSSRLALTSQEAPPPAFRPSLRVICTPVRMGRSLSVPQRGRPPPPGPQPAWFCGSAGRWPRTDARVGKRWLLVPAARKAPPTVSRATPCPVRRRVAAAPHASPAGARLAVPLPSSPHTRPRRRRPPPQFCHLLPQVELCPPKKSYVRG